MAWKGEQLGFDDIVVEFGTLDPYDDIWAGLETRADSTVVTLTPGDQFYIYTLDTSVAIEAGDTVALQSWRFNAKGHGTLDLAQSLDPDWSYSPPFTWEDLPSLVLDTDTLTLTATTPSTPYSKDDLNGLNGGMLLRVTCISGTVDLDWFCLQLEPPTGLEGITGYEWSDWITPDLVDQPAADVKYVRWNSDHQIAWTSTNLYHDTDSEDNVNDAVDAARAAFPSVTATVEAALTDLDLAVAESVTRGFVHSSSALAEGLPRSVDANAHVGMTVTSFDWAEYPDHREMPPEFLVDKTLDVDYAVIPGMESEFGYERYVEFNTGDTESIEWTQLIVLGSGGTVAEHFGFGDIDDLGAFGIKEGAWQTGDPIPDFDLATPLDEFVEDPKTYSGGSAISTSYDTWIAFDQPSIGMGFTPGAGDGFIFLARQELAFSTDDIPPPDERPGSPGGAPGWMFFSTPQGNHGRLYDASARPAMILVQMPDYRYWLPLWGPSDDSLLGGWNRLRVWMPTDEWLIIGNPDANFDNRFYVQDITTGDVWREFKTGDTVGAEECHLYVQSPDGPVNCARMIKQT